MNYPLKLLPLIVLIGCNETYPNPDILVELNKPFVLRNTATLAVPEGNQDIAVYIDQDNQEYKFRLDTVVDLRCESCIIQQRDYYVRMRVNEDVVYLGEVLDPDRVSPTGAPIALSVDINDMVLQLLSIEHVNGSDLINQTAKYKEVTLILIR